MNLQVTGYVCINTSGTRKIGVRVTNRMPRVEHVTVLVGKRTSRHIEFGIVVNFAGNSYVPALELHNRLMKMGIYSQCERDAHLQNILISSCGSEDVMVLFSISGGTKDVVDAAALARTCGMRIIVVTSHDKSPLTRFADVVLSSVPTESPTEAGAMASKIIQLFLVDILCTGIYFKDKKKYGDCIAKSNAAVVGKLI